MYIHVRSPLFNPMEVETHGLLPGNFFLLLVHHTLLLTAINLSPFIAFLCFCVALARYDPASFLRN